MPRAGSSEGGSCTAGGQQGAAARSFRWRGAARAAPCAPTRQDGAANGGQSLRTINPWRGGVRLLTQPRAPSDTMRPATKGRSACMPARPMRALPPTPLPDATPRSSCSRGAGVAAAAEPRCRRRPCARSHASATARPRRGAPHARRVGPRAARSPEPKLPASPDQRGARARTAAAATREGRAPRGRPGPRLEAELQHARQVADGGAPLRRQAQHVLVVLLGGGGRAGFGRARRWRGAQAGWPPCEAAEPPGGRPAGAGGPPSAASRARRRRPPGPRGAHRRGGQPQALVRLRGLLHLAPRVVLQGVGKLGRPHGAARTVVCFASARLRVCLCASRARGDQRMCMLAAAPCCRRMGAAGAARAAMHAPRQVARRVAGLDPQYGQSITVCLPWLTLGPAAAIGQV
jgi:hypothetical protein